MCIYIACVYILIIRDLSGRRILDRGFVRRPSTDKVAAHMISELQLGLQLFTEKFGGNEGGWVFTFNNFFY